MMQLQTKLALPRAAGTNVLTSSSGQHCSHQLNVNRAHSPSSAQTKLTAPPLHAARPCERLVRAEWAPGTAATAHAPGRGIHGGLAAGRSRQWWSLAGAGTHRCRRLRRGVNGAGRLGWAGQPGNHANPCEDKYAKPRKRNRVPCMWRHPATVCTAAVQLKQYMARAPTRHASMPRTCAPQQRDLGALVQLGAREEGHKLIEHGLISTVQGRQAHKVWRLNERPGVQWRPLGCKDCCRHTCTCVP